MPWRNFYNDKLETYTTTDMSQLKREQLKADGWHEATDLEFRLASAIQGYDPKVALLVLQDMIEKAGR